ncbi:hypothetical protein AURDEDRAFT_176107 [Auricularia subglabra TFB-10046 SS5]|uniref:tRNA-splicing endonuclease subunit Sen15 domain-containing protein n=1 Tax=Auricularia subglabra (strain TFB-10046 / SS5) TaxID=717982 RepID=J0CWC1_AURST|nr:hypothetical protein AURDEDRAFT_176107 [Auricularia subglabra TFB-10046 SS5]
MDRHPAYKPIAGLMQRYPVLAGSLFQVYNDLMLAQQWEELQPVELPNAGRVVVKGKRPKTDNVQYVLPCSLAESLSLAGFGAVFRELEGVSEVHVGICSEDSSVVYYRLSRGIVKPPM